MGYDKELVNDGLCVLGSRSYFLDFFGDNAHTFFDTFLIPDGYFSDGSDAFFDEFWVNLVHIFFQLFQDQFVVFVVDDSGKDLYFFVFNVVRVREFGKETLYIILKHWRSLLNYVLDVFQNDILHLLRREWDHWYDGRGELFDEIFNELLPRQIV